MEAIKLVDDLREFYNDNPDKEFVIDFVKRELDNFDLVKKRIALEKAIEEYLKEFYDISEVPKDIIDIMADRINKPVYVKHTFSGAIFYDN